MQTSYVSLRHCYYEERSKGCSSYAECRNGRTTNVLKQGVIKMDMSVLPNNISREFVSLINLRISGFFYIKNELQDHTTPGHMISIMRHLTKLHHDYVGDAAWSFVPMFHFKVVDGQLGIDLLDTNVKTTIARVRLVEVIDYETKGKVLAMATGAWSEIGSFDCLGINIISLTAHVRILHDNMDELDRQVLSGIVSVCRKSATKNSKMFKFDLRVTKTGVTIAIFRDGLLSSTFCIRIKPIF